MSNLKFAFLIFTGIILLSFSNCGIETQAEKDKGLILNYLQDNNIDAIEHETGIYYVITREGNGEHPVSTSRVKVKYKGYLLNGEVFDETTGDDTYTSYLYNFIQGWQIGIPLLSIGGAGTFYIPSHLGYGSQSAGTIPSNSVLVFEIELVDFQ